VDNKNIIIGRKLKAGNESHLPLPHPTHHYISFWFLWVSTHETTIRNIVPNRIKIFLRATSYNDPTPSAAH